MKKYSSLIAACVIAVLVGAVLSVRMLDTRKRFNHTVKEMLKTSEGYDQKFIDVVNRLEQVLALRASFGYLGGKDPMTGKVRTVAVNMALDRTGQVSSDTSASQTPDKFKLTAIIYDDEIHRYTAVVMLDERSYSVEVSDRVGDKVVRKITASRVYLESDSLYSFYDLSGEKGLRKKIEGTLPPPMP